MRRFQSFLVLITAVLFCTEASAFTASYKQTSSGPGLVSPETQLIKIKDDKIRIEMESAERGKGIAMIEGDTMISYLPSQNIAYKVKSNMSRDMNVFSDYALYLKGLNAKVVGSEKIGPYECDIYVFIDPRIKTESKVWLWKEKQFPVRVEIKVPGGVMTTVMENVKIGVYLDDSEFRLPPGVKVVEISETPED